MNVKLYRNIDDDYCWLTFLIGKRSNIALLIKWKDVKKLYPRFCKYMRRGQTRMFRQANLINGYGLFMVDET